MLSSESKGLSKLDFNECSVQFLLRMDKTLGDSIDTIEQYMHKAAGASIVLRSAGMPLEPQAEYLKELRKDIREVCRARNVDMSIFAAIEEPKAAMPRRW